MKLLLATNNQKKLEELRRLVAGRGWEVAGPGEIGLQLDVEEDGETYAANAEKKARAFAEATGLIAIADDSGLEVDALDGRPGVYSARYGGPGLDDEGRWRLLLEEMAGVPGPKRTARYRAVVAVAEPGGEVRTFEGTCEGHIATEARGHRGFGYDPVFLTADGRTAAELPEHEKDAISHRGQAMRKAIEDLQEPRRHEDHEGHREST